MPTDLSANTRIHLAQSLASVEREKDAIADRVVANLTAPGGRAVTGGDRQAARDLVDGLIGHARSVVETGHHARSEAAPAALRSLEDAGHGLARIGDALAPILKDVLGSAIPRPAVAAWSTLFWVVAARDRTRKPALAA